MTDDSQQTRVLPARLQVRQGSFVRHKEKLYQITDMSDLGSVIAIDIEEGYKRQLKIAELVAAPVSEELIARGPLGLDAFTGKDFKIANERLKKIRPLVDMKGPSRAAFEQQAREAGVHYTTLYRWYRSYTDWRDVTALVPGKKGRKRGNYGIPEKTEAIMTYVIENYFLNPERWNDDEPVARPSIEDAITLIQSRCRKEGIDPPSNSTIRLRIDRIPEWKRMRRRGERKKARDKFRPVPGHFPNADFPLAVVQIDHTYVDLILVDDDVREPIGRIWLTLAIDVYSRMVTGYYLSLDPPSTTSVAMCISHSILPKELWLSDKDVKAEWPVFGLPTTIHVDNGPDFRTRVLRNACQKYGINLQFRPVKVPEYGGHIERLAGTLGKKIHNLPGTTFSSVKEKGEYDSEKNAIFTVSEFEQVLLDTIVNIYHRQEHKGIGRRTPLTQWNIGMRRFRDTPGIELPDLPGNPVELERDFLPMFERTVQRDGVSIDGLTYHESVLNPWIGAPDPNDPRRRRKHIFRRDPRNITTIWFWEPEVDRYFTLPTTQKSLPPMSIWDFREAKKLARREGKDPKDPDVRLDAHERINQKKKDAWEATKKQRRDNQRRRTNQGTRTPAAVNAPGGAAEQMPPDDFSTEPVEGFQVFR